MNIIYICKCFIHKENIAVQPLDIYNNYVFLMKTLQIELIEIRRKWLKIGRK